MRLSLTLVGRVVVLPCVLGFAACNSGATPTSTPTPTIAVTATVDTTSTTVFAPRLTSTPTPMLPLYYEYETVAGDTLALVAARFDVSEAVVRLSNASLDREPAPGTVLRVPSVEGVLHTVELGETLSDIAERYGVTMDAITGFASNGLSSGNNRAPGAVILVPGGTGE